MSESSDTSSGLVRLLVFWGLNVLVLWVAAELLPGVSVSGPGPLLLAGLVFGLVNTYIKPVLVLLTLPVTILTLGFFLLVLNGLILLLVAWLVPGFRVGSFWQAVGAALLVSVLGFALNLIRRR